MKCDTIVLAFAGCFDIYPSYLADLRCFMNEQLAASACLALLVCDIFRLVAVVFPILLKQEPFSTDAPSPKASLQGSRVTEEIVGIHK